MESYDLEHVYDEQISPLMMQIIDICRQHRIPMLATFAYAADGNGETSWCTSSLEWATRHNPQLTAAIDLITQRQAPQVTIVATVG